MKKQAPANTARDPDGEGVNGEGDLTPHRNPLYSPSLSSRRMNSVPQPAGSGAMPSSDILNRLGLNRNPFTDRTAEKARLDLSALYVHSDLQGFQPNETTYVFFGKRGSGKTTIRLQMQEAYRSYNEKAVRAGGMGHLLVDLSRPGNVSSCLTTFKRAIACAEDAWDAAFAEHWSESDVVDCILSIASTELVDRLTNPDDPLMSARMVKRLQADPRAARHMLLLAHLYAVTDASTLARLRADLTPPRDWTRLLRGAGVVGGVGAAVAGASRVPQVREALDRPLQRAREETERTFPWIFSHPRVAATVAAATAGALLYTTMQARARWSLARAARLQQPIRVVRHIDPAVLSSLLDALFTRQDRAADIQTLYVGTSTSQKLELLYEVARVVGFESVAVFGDCFDECPLLDPVAHPTALKVFASRICRNDLLSCGRQHWFFPDSRLALDLSTDRTLKEARFDRHFVRDLQWSRHQLEQLAQRRFEAARAHGSGGQAASFEDLFTMIGGEDFSSYLSKVTTPRELLIMMTQLLTRLESNPGGALTAQDMEIAVEKAKEQNV